MNERGALTIWVCPKCGTLTSIAFSECKACAGLGTYSTRSMIGDDLYYTLVSAEAIVPKNENT